MNSNNINNPSGSYLLVSAYHVPRARLCCKRIAGTTTLRPYWVGARAWWLRTQNLEAASGGSAIYWLCDLSKLLNLSVPWLSAKFNKIKCDLTD